MKSMNSRAVLGCVTVAALGALGGWLWSRLDQAQGHMVSKPAEQPALSRADQPEPSREGSQVVRSDSRIAMPVRPRPATVNGKAFSLEQPSSDFGGFVPSNTPLAASLWFSYHNCHTPGAPCGHESYIDLIPEIMAKSDHDPDSWAGKMEQQIKAHFDASTSALKVEQIHCGDSGCLIDLTQEKADRTFLQGTALYKEAREALIAERWFAEDFFTTYGDSPFTGFGQYWGDPSDKFEEFWVFARKTPSTSK